MGLKKTEKYLEELRVDVPKAPEYFEALTSKLS